MDWYSIDIEYRAPNDTGTDAVTDQAIENFMNLVEPHDGVAGGGPGYDSFDAVIGVEAEDAAAAESQGRQIVDDARRQAEMPDWPIVKISVTREDVMDEEIARPQLPDLVSGPEAAEILGVTRQRVHQLAHKHPDFPDPAYRLGVGTLWFRSGIEGFNNTWERRTGRPPLHALG